MGAFQVGPHRPQLGLQSIASPLNYEVHWERQNKANAALSALKFDP